MNTDAEIASLVSHFVVVTKKYQQKYGWDDLSTSAYKYYTKGLAEWHDYQCFPDESTVTSTQRTAICNFILDFLAEINKKDPTIKERAIMKKSSLFKFITESINEAMAESTPPHFPGKLKQKLISRYGETPKAYATMWALHKKLQEGDRRVKEMWIANECATCGCGDPTDDHLPKVEENGESDMSDPAEKREVEIGKAILKLCDPNLPDCGDLSQIELLAQELIKMHKDNYSGPPRTAIEASLRRKARRERERLQNESIGDWAGWGKETPVQKASEDKLTKLGFQYTHHFPENEEDDPEQRMVIVMSKRRGPTTFTCQIGSDGSANGELIDAYIKNFRARMLREEYDSAHDAFMADAGEEDDREMFADPHGRSALRAASKHNPRNRPCPTCHRPNMLTPADVARGYQCDRCADAQESGVDEGNLVNTAKAIGAAGIMTGAAIGGHYLGKLNNVVTIGGTSYLVVPEDHGKVPYDAKTVKGPDGKTYKVWSGQSGYKTRTPDNFAYKVN
jgi:hypothetical protein